MQLPHSVCQPRAVQRVDRRTGRDRTIARFPDRQYIREEGPEAHQEKAGTPTMGGWLIVIAIVVPTLPWADLSNRFLWIAVFSTRAYAAIGFTDDYTKVTHRRNLGLTARTKFGAADRVWLRNCLSAHRHAGT